MDTVGARRQAVTARRATQKCRVGRILIEAAVSAAAICLTPAGVCQASDAPAATSSAANLPQAPEAAAGEDLGITTPGPKAESPIPMMTIHLKRDVLRTLPSDQLALVQKAMGPVQLSVNTGTDGLSGGNGGDITVHIPQDAFEEFDADQLRTIFGVIGPVEGVHMIQRQIERFPEYECTLRLWERVGGSWTKTPAYIFVKYKDKPRQVYARWLRGGRHSGQEILYDETKSTTKMYGHLGGFLGMVSLWTSVDGFFAKQQSKHTVQDLGMQFVGKLMLSDATSFEREGLSGSPKSIELVDDLGMKLLSMTWEAPPGRPGFYASRTQAMFDLQNMLPRVVSAWDAGGNQIDKMEIVSLEAVHWDQSSFDPRSKEYHF